MIDLIPASHRTTTVCRLLAGMQAEDAWDRWPLLRDALMDADAPETVLRDVFEMPA